MTTAIVLFSGGLDSLLTTKILQAQDINVIGLHVATPFQDSSKDAALWAEKFGIELVVEHLGDEYVKLLANPRWGVGKGVNPCIDCRIAMCRAAARLMEERGADFVATGEIAGQRPNSQKLHQLNLITKESGLKGKLLRPLTAKTLAPTEPELTGLVDREKLYSYTGRSRGRLIRRARETFGIRPIPQPSTGCLLAEKSFAPRVRDYLKYNSEPTLWGIESLLAGRHLRLNERIKAAVSRNEEDGKKLAALFNRTDRGNCFFLSPENFMGPSVLTFITPETDPITESDIALTGSLLLRFSNQEKLAKIGGPAELDLSLSPEKTEIIKAYPDSAADLFRMIEETVKVKKAPEENEPEQEELG